MTKRIITISREFEAVDVLSGKSCEKKLELLITIKILSMRLQKSLVYHRNMFLKMQNYLRKKGCLPMHLPDVI